MINFCEKRKYLIFHLTNTIFFQIIKMLIIYFFIIYVNYLIILKFYFLLEIKFFSEFHYLFKQFKAVFVFSYIVQFFIIFNY